MDINPDTEIKDAQFTQSAQIPLTPALARAALLRTVPITEILAELERRFPTFILAYNTRPENAPRSTSTVARYSRDGLDSDILGLAHTAVLEVSRALRDGFGVMAEPLPVLKKG